MTDDATPAPAVLAQDVVDIGLRPRPGGRPSRGPAHRGDMLAGIRRDLATLDPDTFLTQWTSRTER